MRGAFAVRLGRRLVRGLGVAVGHLRVLFTLGVVALGVVLRRCAMRLSSSLVSLGSLRVCWERPLKHCRSSF